MIKIILIFFIISLITGNNKPTGYLYCGLFGWVGKHPANFNRHAFTILGIKNEGRGGDSCGVYSNNTIKYGTGYSRDFPTFIKKISRVKAGKDCVVIGHTRKASIGIASPKNAQPVVLQSKAGSPGFVLTHNGTLTDYKEMAKKYGLNIKNLDTDSQILAALMYDTDAGTDILGEYNGSAALVFHTVGTNTIFIFKGKSKSSSNYAHTTEERPLYGYQESPNSFYYSSLKNPLELIAKDQENIFDIKCNILYQVEAGEFSEVRLINREDNYQRYITPYVPPVSNAYDYHKNWDGWGGRGGNNIDHRRVRGTGDTTKWISPPSSIASENLIHLGTSMMTFTKGRYHLGEHLVHGKVKVNDHGLLFTGNTNVQVLYDLFFWEGVLLFGEDEFEALNDKKKRDNFVSSLDELLLSSGPYPVCIYNTTDIKSLLYESNDAFADYTVSFTGQLCPIFCSKEYTVRDGLVTKIISRSTIKKLQNKIIKNINTWN